MIYDLTDNRTISGEKNSSSVSRVIFGGPLLSLKRRELLRGDCLFITIAVLVLICFFGWLNECEREIKAVKARTIPKMCFIMTYATERNQIQKTENKRINMISLRSGVVLYFYTEVIVC